MIGFINVVLGQSEFLNVHDFVHRFCLKAIQFIWCMMILKLYTNVFFPYTIFSVDDGFPTVAFGFENSLTLTIYPREYLFQIRVSNLLCIRFI